MIWQDRERVDPTKRKMIDENGVEQDVNIEEIESNITQSGTPVNARTMNNIEQNLGTYGNDTYDSTATYLEGETVTHNALLYRAKQDIETPEEWTAAHWEQTSALGELSRTSGNEIAYGLDNITRQSKAVVYATNYRTINQEVNIGIENPSNIKTWFKKSKNLANNILTTQTESDITITKNSDGTIKLNGTASANVTKTIAVVNLLGGKTYTLSGGENLSTETVRLDMRTSEGGSIYNNWYLPAIPTRTITNDVKLYLTMRIQSGASFTNKIIYPMLEENSTATTYEPYIVPSIIADDTEFYSQDNYEKYSLDETKIGTWIDGKPIYKACFQGTTFTIGGSQNYVEIGSNIDTLVNYSGYVQSSDSVQWGIPFYRSDNRFSSIIRLTQNTLRLDVDKIATYNKYLVWVEYTKTTD